MSQSLANIVVHLVYSNRIEYYPDLARFVSALQAARKSVWTGSRAFSPGYHRAGFQPCVMLRQRKDPMGYQSWLFRVGGGVEGTLRVLAGKSIAIKRNRNEISCNMPTARQPQAKERYLRET